MKTSEQIIEIIEATSVIEDCINGNLSTTVAYGILEQALSKALSEEGGQHKAANISYCEGCGALKEYCECYANSKQNFLNQ